MTEPTRSIVVLNTSSLTTFFPSGPIRKHDTAKGANQTRRPPTSGFMLDDLLVAASALGVVAFGNADQDERYEDPKIHSPALIINAFEKSEQSSMNGFISVN